MTGRQLDDLYDSLDTSYESLCMPSCLSLLLRLKDTFKKLQECKKFSSSVYVNDQKVCQFKSIVTFFVL